MAHKIKTIKDFYNFALLNDKSREHEIKVKILLMYCNNIDTFSRLTLHFNDEMKNKRFFKSALKKINGGYPVQYIVKGVNFFGYDFFINENTLIPRPETEELVDIVIEYLKTVSDKDLIIADICTGSGVIGLTLAKTFPNYKVICTDLSKKALKVAKINNKKLETKALILQGNHLMPLIENNIKVDVIVANPPYILNEDFVEENVKNFEPHIALYDQGFTVFKNIVKYAYKVIKENGRLYFEVSEHHAEEMLNFVKMKLTLQK